MTRRVTATEARAKFFALLDSVAQGEEIEITRYGRIIAVIVPVKSPSLLKNRHAGLVTTNASDKELFSTGVKWEAQ